MNVLENKLKKHIKKGDIIYVEANLFNFYKKNSHYKLSDLPFNTYNMFKNLLGQTGTLSVPTFTFSWGEDSDKKIFNVEKDKCTNGIFSEYIRNLKKSIRTLDPMFSCCIIGKKSKKLSKISNDTFGNQSFYHKLFLTNAKIITYCLDKFDPTFIHFIEQYFNENINKINYRKIYIKSGRIKNTNKITKKLKIRCWLRKKGSKFFFNDKKLKEYLIKSKNLIEVKDKGLKIYIINAVDLFEACIINLKKNKYFLVK